jgi:BlaI family transcriptional regulator, penicillinase repressor
MASVSISDAEWQVMSVVWDRQPATAQDVVAGLRSQADWAPATIKTMLHRLVRKKILAYQLQGNRYVYRARARRSDCVRQESRSFLERVFDGEPGTLVTHFLRNAKLSSAEIRQLRKILDEQEARS